MMKNVTTPHQICDQLNKLLSIDPVAISKLFQNREVCNDKLADLPELPVLYLPGMDAPKIGLIGILNSFFGTNDGRQYAFQFEFDDNNPEIITKFKVSSELVEHSCSAEEVICNRFEKLLIKGLMNTIVEDPTSKNATCGYLMPMTHDEMAFAWIHSAYKQSSEDDRKKLFEALDNDDVARLVLAAYKKAGDEVGKGLSLRSAIEYLEESKTKN